MAKRGGIEGFHTKVVGVTHRNEDGSNRQKIIRNCRPGEQLELIHDKNNRFDLNAMKVCRKNGQQVGFLNAELAEEVVASLAQGYRYIAFVSNITGGGKRYWGMNLRITVVTPAGDDYAVEHCVGGFDLSDAPTRVSNALGAIGREAMKIGCAILLGLILVIALVALLSW